MRKSPPTSLSPCTPNSCRRSSPSMPTRRRHRPANARAFVRCAGNGECSGCRAARGAAGVRAGIRVRPGSLRMRARLPGARGIGTGWDAIVRADGECARVCPRIRGSQSRGLPASGFRQPPLVANARACVGCAGNRGWSGRDCARGWRMRARLWVGVWVVSKCRMPPTGWSGAFWQIVFGGVLLSHTLSSAVPSALEGLASGFGMGPGVSPPLWPP